MTAAERLNRERERLAGCYAFEGELAAGARYIFGVDEAGRGPLCGPVVAACCMLPEEDPGILYLNDSKKLSEKRRQQVFAEIKEKAVSYGIGMADERRIDEINILNATFEAMKDAFKACMAMYREKNAAEAEGLPLDELIGRFEHIPGISDSVVLVDGNRTVPGIMLPQRAVVGGDAKCPSISAASILAKVTRDSIMLEYAERYPEYGFRTNKGYGTREHMDAIRRYGVLDIHRRSFLKNIR